MDKNEINLTSANLIDKDEIQAVQDSIELVNSLESGELKAMRLKTSRRRVYF